MNFALTLAIAFWVALALWASILVAESCRLSVWLRYPKLLLLPLIGDVLVVAALIEQGGDLEPGERRQWVLDYILEWAGVPEDDAELEA